MTARPMCSAKHPTRTLLPVMAADRTGFLQMSPASQRIGTWFNQREPLFRDVRVRRAVLGYGIDRQAIAKTALLGLGQPLWSFVPPGSRGQIDFGEHLPYDLERARALLKEAGYGEKKPLQYTLVTHGAEASLATIATSMKTQLAIAWGRRGKG